MDFKTPLFLLFVLLSTSQALKFDIGESSGWSLNPSESYSQWSGRNRFQVNDILVFKYKKGSDSVLEVTKEAYDKCNKTNPIKKFDDGNTEFSLDRSGPFYFISGNDQNCEKGQKIALVVISPRGHHTPSSAAPSPSTTTPSPSGSPLPSVTSPSPSVSTSPSPSVSTSPTANSPSVSTPPAGEPTAPPPTAGGPPAPSPMSPSTGAAPPSPSPTIPSDGAAAPGSESLAPGAAAVPPASSDSIAPSSSLVYSVAVVVGAVFLCYGNILG